MMTWIQPDMDIEQLWTAYDFCDVEDPEELDIKLDAVLEAMSEQGAMTNAGDLDALSQLFGMSEQALVARVGVPIATDVAKARFVLILSALTRCLELASDQNDEASGALLQQALSVCACLQFETLGDVRNSDAAFKQNILQVIPYEALCSALMDASKFGYRVVLAFIRSLIDLENADDISAKIIEACLPIAGSSKSLEVIRDDMSGDHHLDDVLMVLAMVESLADSLASTAFDVQNSAYQQETLLKKDQSSDCYVSYLVSAFSAFEARTPLTSYDFAQQRLHAHLAVMSSAKVRPSLSLANDILDEGSSQKIWREICQIPALRVVAPILYAPLHMQRRIGPSAEVDAQMAPLQAIALHCQVKNVNTQQNIFAATAVLAVLSHLADTGLITGKRPENLKAKSQYQQRGREADSVLMSEYVVPFDRKTGLGRLLGLAADTATLLAYIDPAEEGLKPSELTPLGWVTAPLHDDVRYDLALSAVLSVMSILDESIFADVARLCLEIMQPSAEQNLQAFQPLFAGPETGYRGRVEPWSLLADRLWRATAGLSKELPCRVNFWGEDVGLPAGGMGKWQGPFHDANGHLDTISKALQDEIKLSNPMPSRYVAGYFMSDKAYWSHAQSRGRILRQGMDEIVGGSHALSGVFVAGGDRGLQRLIVQYMTLCADEEARKVSLLDGGCLQGIFERG